MCNVKDAKYYQELTYEALGKILEEARKGQSTWYCEKYRIGAGMKNFLERKGFHVNGWTTNFQNIS